MSDEGRVDTLATTGDRGGPCARAEVAAPRRRIGRYALVRRLGAGGMGVVWEASDPELGRGVAIKVLRDGGGSGRWSERMRREAQVLARLHHPNVVAVYDVGIDDGELYIVMQLVAGATLDAVLARAPRPSVAAVIELLVQAGRGLAAAHAAGIVHRDFKPTNVLVDAGGVVRVSDFGLARASDASDDVPTLDGGGPIAASITRGELVGTPAYMAPEQFLGGPVTAATDQFAFCVALWEALAGERPYAGAGRGDRVDGRVCDGGDGGVGDGIDGGVGDGIDDRAADGVDGGVCDGGDGGVGDGVDALRAAVLAERRGELPGWVPRRIRAALVRGLSRDPAARFPSMTALLAELAPARRAAWIGGGAGLVALAAAAFALGAGRSGGDDPCLGVGAPADAVWSLPARAAIASAFGAAAPPVLAALDERTARWRSARGDACRASYVRRDPQPLDQLEVRYACLDRSLADQRAAIALLVAPPEPGLRVRWREILDGGHDAGECTRKRAADTLAAAHGAPPVRDDLLYGQLATMYALAAAGRNADMLALRAVYEPRVAASHDHELTASFHFRVGQAYTATGDVRSAKEQLRRSAEVALRAGDDGSAARAWARLAALTSTLGNMDGVDNLLAMARGAAERSGLPLPPVWVEIAEGQVAIERGGYDLARSKCAHALDAATAAGERSAHLMPALGCMFDAEMAAGRGAAAVLAARRVLEARLSLGGPAHPEVAAAHRALASALAIAGDHAAAAAEWRLALTRIEHLHGPTSLELMYALRDQALALSPDGARSTPEALAAIERAASLAAHLLPARDPRHAGILESLALVHAAHGHRARSIAAYERALAVYETTDDPHALSRVLYNYADELKNANRCDRAVPLFQRAARVAASTGERTALAAGGLYGAGACLGAARAWAEAEAALTRSIEEFDRLDYVLFAGQSRWELAEQLARRGRRGDALALARTAVAKLSGRPPPADALAQQITAWIAKQGG